MKQLGLSIVQACDVMALGRSTYYRQPRGWRVADSAVIDALNEQLKKSPRTGFWKCYVRMRLQGYTFNHKRVYSDYCLMGHTLKRRTKRVLPKRTPKPHKVLPKPNHQWALDFMHDSLYCGRTFRTLNIIDEGTRECLGIEVDTSLPAQRVIRTLKRIKEQRSLPKPIRLDNGPELIAATFVDWCETNDIELAYIKPGKPQQNGFAERFNGSFRREFLDAYLFENLDQVRQMAWVWQHDYTHERPHDSLGRLTPVMYRQTLENASLDLSHE